MLQMLVDAGIKPHLALTGTPLALVPPGEAVLRHPAYGCVNAPGIDLTRPEPRSRMPEWWQLQDAFIGALVDRFGKEEVQRWTFATWTEPHNPKRKLAHLVLPAELVRSGRHDEAAATVLATSIDVAMKHGVRIGLGNLAGSVETEYPKLVREIAMLPRGKAYLDYVEGYAISRYRTNPAKDIGNGLDAGFTLLKNPAMPDKALFIDELGDLSGGDGADPFEGAKVDRQEVRQYIALFQVPSSMHFRFRNNLVQVIRTTYDPATKKPRTEIVGRLSRSDPVPGPDLQAACTAAEIDEVQRWIGSHMKTNAVAAEHAARTLAEQIEKAATWFASTQDHDSARELAAEAQQQWARLRNQFRRSGLLD